MSTTPPLTTERDRTTLSAFVVRARRIEEHSLAADKKALLRWSQQQLQIRVTDGKGVVRWDLPAEEALDSLAARCRPLLLKSEALHAGKVLDAIERCVAGDAELIADLAGLRSQWAKLDRDNPDLLGYQSQTGSVGGELGAVVTDKKLAYAWLYGDLVHADDVARRSAGHHIDYRYQGAVGLITTAAVMSIATLNLVRAAQQRRFLDLEDNVFTQRVTPRTSVEVKLGGLVMAPVGTPVDEMTALLEAEPAVGHGDGQPHTEDRSSSPES